MESSTEAGLTIIYDDETGILTFEWDENTHPEYNHLKELTSDDFSAMLDKQINASDGQLLEEQAAGDHTSL